MIEESRYRLDEAIDRVAGRLVALPDDDRMLQRVLARLPERAASPWYLAMPAQLAAGAALVLVAFLWARPLDRPEMPLDSRPQSQSRPPAQVRPTPAPRAAIAGATGVRSLIPDPRSPIPDPRSPIPDDHERSLAPVDAIESLELSSIGAPALEFDAAAALEPLVLTELLLASDLSSPR